MKGAVQGVATIVASTPVQRRRRAPLGQRAVRRRPASADAEIGDAGEAQPHRKQQIGEQADNDRRLQLEAPADRRPAGAQRNRAPPSAAKLSMTPAA